MKVVIDIPESLYKFYKTYIGSGKLKVEEDILGRLLNNGKVLPKGHGELLDANVLLDKWYKLSPRGRTEFDQVIMCTPVVIPADEGE